MFLAIHGFEINPSIIGIRDAPKYVPKFLIYNK